MSRYDREDIDFLNLPDPDPTKANYYIDNGIVIERSEYIKMQDPPIICGKEIQNKETKITTYFILCNNRNQMFDPKENDSRYKRRDLWRFRRVNRSTFDIYVKFLKQHYRSLLSQAERGL